MPWCRRCDKQFSRIERENVNKPKLCGDCARDVNRQRINNIKKQEVGKNDE